MASEASELPFQKPTVGGSEHPWYIFNEQKLRFHLSQGTQELSIQVIARIRSQVTPRLAARGASLCRLAEPCARVTSDQDIRLGKVLYLSYVAFMKRNMGQDRLICCSSVRITVICPNDFDACLLGAQIKSAAAGKEGDSRKFLQSQF